MSYKKKCQITKNKLIFKNAFRYKLQYNLFNYLIRNEYPITQYNG